MTVIGAQRTTSGQSMGFRSCPFCVIRLACLTSILRLLPISSSGLGGDQLRVRVTVAEILSAFIFLRWSRIGFVLNFNRFTNNMLALCLICGSVPRQSHLGLRENLCRCTAADHRVPRGRGF
jgi:hypothetical protein